jgi:hypothetical protein
MQRLIPRCFGKITRHQARIPFHASRQFSVSIPRQANTLMETSGFSDTQLQVREAIAKICSNFPDVSSGYWLFTYEQGLKLVFFFFFRNIGLHMMSRESILMNYIEHYPKMVGLVLLFPKSLEGLVSAYQRQP